MEVIKSFTELFKFLELGDTYADFAYILDAPKATFDTIKDDFRDSLLQSISIEQLNQDLVSVGGFDVQISELKEEILNSCEVFKSVFDEIEHELPQDRVDFFLELIKGLKDNVLSLPERKIVKVIIEKINKDAIIPTYAHKTDAGADIYANEDINIEGGKTVIVKTGLKVAIPEGWEIQIRPRSGMSAKTPIRIANAPGTIDAGYRDEIGVICHNTSTKDYSIKKGDRIAQMVISPVPMINFIEGNVTNIEGNRGGGFGSTGANIKVHNG